MICTPRLGALQAHLVGELHDAGVGQLDLCSDLGQALVGALSDGGLQGGGVVDGAQHGLVARPLALHEAQVCPAGAARRRLMACTAAAQPELPINLLLQAVLGTVCAAAALRVLTTAIQKQAGQADC